MSHLVLGGKMDTKERCPICGNGHVTNHVDQVESEYKGHKSLLPLHYQLCDACHSDFASVAASKLNKRAVMAFRKSVDGLLTGAEICALREKYKLTQAQAARLFGGGPVAFSKYENDDVSQSEPMDKLLRLVRRSELAFWELLEECGMAGAFSKEKVLATTSRSANVVLMENYRAEVPLGAATVTFRRYGSGDTNWK